MENITQSSKVSNSSYHHFNEDFMEELSTRIVKSILIFFVIIAVSFGNILCVIVIRKTTSLHTPSGNFMISLAVADFCLGALVAPISLSACIIGRWVFPSALCVGMGFIAFYASSVSILSLIMLTIDRWISIIWPFKYHTLMTTKTSYISSLCIWIGVFVIEIPMTFPDVGRFHYVEGVWFCCPKWEENTVYTYVIVSIILLPSYFIVLILNVYLFCKAKVQIKKIMSISVQGPEQSSQYNRISLLKTTFMTFTVVVVFDLCWLPYFVVELLHFYNLSYIHRDVRFVTNLMASMNSFMNCCIYYWLNRNFRKGAKKLFHMK